MKTLIIALALLAGTAQAATFSGNDLYAGLNGNETQRLAALRYIKGAWDGIELTQLLTDQKAICTPSDVVAGQVADIVRANLTARPQIRHEEAATLVYVSLLQAWPCKAAPTKQRGQSL